MKPDTTYIRLFHQLPEESTDSDITHAVMIRIEHARIVRARWHFGLHATSALVAIIVCVPVAQSFMTAASQSGFYTYLSLISSDWTYALASWKNLGLSLIESAPLLEATIFLGLVLVIGNALRRGTHYIPLIHQYE